MFGLFKKFFDYNERELTKLQPLIRAINDKEEEIKRLKDSQFAQKTAEFKKRIAEGEEIDNLVVETFALAREAAWRVIGERPYDVQLMAAIVLHQGRVAEQKTGEGKTLSAVPALYLNALTGRGVHLVTVNDYLARRDAGWMGIIFHLLGLTTAAIIHDESFIYNPKFVNKSAQDWRLRNLKPISRKEAYQADVTYGINSEFGFDYLRDNMATDPSQLVQRGFHYAIVDEVDSVLIDEARTPHIISAPDMEATDKYYKYAKLAEKLHSATDYEVDEKLRTVHLTEHGIKKVEKMLGVDNLYEKDFETVHHIEASLKAKTLFRRDKEYVVKDNQIVIVDEFTGRLLHGRRYSEGLHQAIEAKEGVPIQRESKTLATVSLQNYFRMYEKLAGMTGTAATEAEEFHKIYDLDVVVIPTNKPMIRKNHTDMVYKTMRAKYGAVAREVEAANKRGQPVLVGTSSIEHNEIVAQLLDHKGIKYSLLNAKHHAKEAVIIADAGKKGAVTVATNMAGRGVDIILGGSPPNKHEYEKGAEDKEYKRLKKEWQRAHDEVVKSGGLYVIGTEKHESRRIDNQLRGRSGRQGDPGASRFFVSLEDDLMRIFGGDQIAKLMTMFNLPEDVPLEHSMVTKAIEQAQVKVEGFNFDTRKHLVEYDDVLNKQREIVYRFRRQALESEEGDYLKDKIIEKVKKTIRNLVVYNAPNGIAKEEIKKIIQEFTTIIPFEESTLKQMENELSSLSENEEIIDFLIDVSIKVYEEKEKQISSEIMRQIERWVFLSVIDKYWMDHLTTIEHLRAGIGLRGYGQRDPLVEYKNEAFSMFERLMSLIDSEIVRRIYRVNVQMGTQKKRVAPPDLSQASPLAVAARYAVANVEAGKQNIGSVAAAAARAGQTSGGVAPSQAVKTVRKGQKIGRNDPCWCGSGKKFKKCHYPEWPSG